MKLSIAIPDSSVSDESTHLGKSTKISLIARTCAIFRVQTIYIYRERSGSDNDRSLIRTILKYLETPQYLRRGLFQRISELRFAGSLSPLKIPHHSYTSDSRKIKVGDMREGMIEDKKSPNSPRILIERSSSCSETRVRKQQTSA